MISKKIILFCVISSFLFGVLTSCHPLPDSPGTESKDTLDDTQKQTDPITVPVTDPITEPETRTPYDPDRTSLPPAVNDLRAAFFTETNMNGACIPYETIDENGLPYEGGLPPLESTPKYENEIAYRNANLNIRFEEMEYAYTLVYYQDELGRPQMVAHIDGNVPLVISFSLSLGTSAADFVECIKNGEYMRAHVLDAVNIHSHESRILFERLPDRNDVPADYPNLIDYPGKEEAITVGDDVEACMVIFGEDGVCIWKLDHVNESPRDYFHTHVRYGLYV